MVVGGSAWWWVVVGVVVVGWVVVGDYYSCVAYYGRPRATRGDHGRPVPAHRFWPGIQNLVL